MLFFYMLMSVYTLIPAALGFSIASKAYAPSVSTRRPSTLHALRAPFFDRFSTSAKVVENRFSLDKPVYVPHDSRLVMLEKVKLAACALTVLSGAGAGSILGRRLLNVAMKTPLRTSQQLNSKPRTRQLDGYSLWNVPQVILGLASKLRHNLARMNSLFSSVLFGEGTPLDLTKWNTATLRSIIHLPGGYRKYRYSLESSMNYLPLGVGQEIVLSLIDADDRVLKESYFPTSEIDARGYFEIISSVNSVDASSSSLTAQEKFARSLMELQPGDEIAFRGGRYRMSGSNPFIRGKNLAARKSIDAAETISKVSVVAAGAGFAPAVQLLRYAFDGAGISSGQRPDLSLGKPLDGNGVRQGELIWLNERNEDFILGDEIRDFKYRYGAKFTVNKELEPDLYSPELLKDGKIRLYIRPYSPGSVAVICAPEHLVEQFRFLYLELGYPVDNILSVMTP